MFASNKLSFLLAFGLIIGCSEKTNPTPAGTDGEQEAATNADKIAKSEGKPAEKDDRKKDDEVAKKPKTAETDEEQAKEGKQNITDKVAPKAAKVTAKKTAREKSRVKEEAADVKKAVDSTRENARTREKKKVKNAKSAVERAALLASGGASKNKVEERSRAATAEQLKEREKPVVLPTVRPAKTNTAIPISHALSAKELKEMTGMKFKPGTLEGQTPSARYNALYFQGERKNDFGVAVQLWHEPALKDTRARYEQMKISFPNVQETGNITNYTFFAHWGKVYHMVFMDLKRRRVASVSSQALSPNQLYTVATRVRDRLLR